MADGLCIRLFSYIQSAPASVSSVLQTALLYASGRCISLLHCTALLTVIAQDLEDELQKQESELMHQIICACLGNILNRSKPVEYVCRGCLSTAAKTQRNTHFARSFKNSLQQLITDKMKTFDIDFETNPLLKQNYTALPLDIKVSLTGREDQGGKRDAYHLLTCTKSCMCCIH